MAPRWGGMKFHWTGCNIPEARTRLEQGCDMDNREVINLDYGLVLSVLCSFLIMSIFSEAQWAWKLCSLSLGELRKIFICEKAQEQCREAWLGYLSQLTSGASVAHKHLGTKETMEKAPKNTITMLPSTLTTGHTFLLLLHFAYLV